MKSFDLDHTRVNRTCQELLREVFFCEVTQILYFLSECKTTKTLFIAHFIKKHQHRIYTLKISGQNVWYKEMKQKDYSSTDGVAHHILMVWSILMVWNNIDMVQI